MGKWGRDTLERGVGTFLGAFLAQAAVTVTGVTDIEAGRAALVAAVAAGVSAALSLLARGYGDDPDSASFEV